MAKVYHSWRRHLDDRPFCLLAYMALIARDHDADPWYGEGHETLAEMALGMELPKDREERDAVLRKVRRAVTPLFAAGAICTKKRATYGRFIRTQVHYRLHLDGPCDCKSQVTERPMAAASTPPQVTERPMDNHPKPVDNHPENPVDNPMPQVTQRPMGSESIGHSVAGHRSLSGRPQVTQRPTKEEEEEEERITSKATVDNGELWKTPAPAATPPAKPINGTHQPSGLERSALRAARRAVAEARGEAS